MQIVHADLRFCLRRVINNHAVELLNNVQPALDYLKDRSTLKNAPLV